MLKSFFAGALVGYFFGCSKQGVQLRESMDRMVTSLLSNDEEESASMEGRDEFGAQAAKEFRNRFGGKRNKSAPPVESRKRSETRPEGTDRSQSSEPDSNNGEGGVTMEKAMALANALNAKPTAPETDELEPS